MRIRREYYEQCGYHLKIQQSKKGALFTSDEGLNTWAYHLQYIQNLSQKLTLPITVIPFSDIGVAYLSAHKIALYGKSPLRAFL